MFPAKDREVSAIENSIKVNRINHVVSIVADTARSLEFYSGFLGIKQIPSQVDNPAITWLQLPSGIMLHLVESQDGPAQPPNLHHAFEVEDLDAATAAVEDKGIPIESSGVRHDGQRYLFIRDPDGNRVELCTPRSSSRLLKNSRRNCPEKGVTEIK